MALAPPWRLPAASLLLGLQDLEKLQAENPDYRREPVDGEVIVMSPSGYEIGNRFAQEIAAENPRIFEVRNSGWRVS